MKRILLITAFTPSRSTAGQHYTFNLLRDISMRYQVDLVYFKYKQEEYVPDNSNVRVVAMHTLSPWQRLKNYLQHPFIHPVFTSRFSYAILQQLRQLVASNQYDIVYFDFSQVFIYSYFIDHPNKVLMIHDVLHQKYERDGFMLEKGWIHRSERKMISEGALQTFSAKDQSLVKAIYGKSSEVVHFYMAPQIAELELSRVKQENYFCFFGAWHRPENSEGLQWFLSEILPETPGVSYVVIGPNLSEAIKAQIKATNQVTYVGFVDNPYEYLASARALIAPLFKGAGVKVKVVEALCCGTPVLGTTIALEGIPNVAGNIIKCDHAVEFKAAILSFDIPSDRKAAFRNLFLKYYNGIRKTTL